MLRLVCDNLFCCWVLGGLAREGVMSMICSGGEKLCLRLFLEVWGVMVPVSVSVMSVFVLLVSSLLGFGVVAGSV